MKIIKIDEKNIRKEEIDLIVKYLKQGKVVVLPTDTIYGLSCLANSKSGIAKIHKIKGSSPKKPLIILVKGYCMLKNFAKVSKKQEKYLRKIWPRTTREAGINTGKKVIPTTVILENRGKKLKYACAGQDNIAVRLPKSEFIYRIISKVGLPLVSTSFNIASQKPPKTFKTLEKEFKVLPDLVVDVEKLGKTKPSYLIDIRDIKKIRILRK